MNAGVLPLLLGILVSLQVCHICLEDEQNLAYIRFARHSSSYQGLHHACGANDRIFTTCSHTQWQKKPWWRLDLYHAHSISSVAVTTRADCCLERINGAEIRIGNSSAVYDYSNALCAQIPSIPAGETRTYQCHGMVGQYVTFSFNSTGTKLLSLCEVKVYARVIHEDINECQDYLGICGPNADCINTPGSYECLCHEGYSELIAVTSSTANSFDPCEDVDECLEDVCGVQTVCHNTVGSFYCTCKDGYISSTGLIWETGISVCQSADDYLDTLDPPEGMSREMFFLNEINKDLAGDPDMVLPAMKVASVLSTTMSVTEKMPPLKGQKELVEASKAALKISEGLASALVEPNIPKNDTEIQGTLRTKNIEINFVSLKANFSKMTSVAAKGNMMSINLVAVAEHNNGTASALLMSGHGMEKFMKPSFFKSENITEMHSDIITAALPKTRHKELPEPVNFTMYHKKQSQAGLVTCVYWKENGTEASWSVEGCAVSFSNEDYTVCSCTHLSTFALLLQTEKLEEEEDPLLEMVNLFCMCVGLAFLAAAILTFLLCRWNPKINNTARLHLCICLFTAHLLFLLGVSRTENAVVCAVIAGVLHFLFLSSFVWMLLETLQLFLLVRSLTKVQVIQKEGLRTIFLLLIGYGTPLVVVGVSAAVFSGGYGSENSCWLRKEKDFHWSFIGPVAAILSWWSSAPIAILFLTALATVINLISFCVILWSLQPTLASMKSDVSQSRDTRLIIFKIVAQFFVLGCAWILGFFQSSTMLKYLFIVLNSQQGTFIFIVHCLLNKEVREEYKKWFSCQSRTKAPSNSTDSKNSTSTVQK